MKNASDSDDDLKCECVFDYSKDFLIKHGMFFLSLVFLFVVTGGSVFAQSNQIEKKATDHPPGTKLVFKWTEFPRDGSKSEWVEEKKFVTVEGKLQILEKRPMFFYENGVRVIKENRTSYKDVETLLSTSPFFSTKALSTWRMHPLTLGQSWLFRGEFLPRNKKATIEQKAEVVAYEEVDLTIGRYWVYKIIYAGTATGFGERWTRNEEYWYAPALGLDVKGSIDTPAHKSNFEIIEIAFPY